MADIICPTDCTTDLPPVSFDQCNPQMKESEITKLYIARPTAIPFEDVSDPLEWGERLSETATPPTGSTVAAGDLIRPLSVIGDRPAPATVTKDLSNRRRKLLRKDFTINFTVDEITPENLTFQRTTECGATVKFWYAIEGGLLFGGNNGIIAELTMDVVLNRGADEIVALNGVLTWSGRFTEEAVDDPLATQGQAAAA